MMASENGTKFVLKLTSLPHDGFKKYTALPPQEYFQRAYSVLGAELEVKVKQKQFFFNRKTVWMLLPVYLIVNKGLLFVYMRKESGYALRISAAKTVTFEATKNGKKKAKKEYSAQVSLQYSFGEIKIKFGDAEVARQWRAILLAAHESLKDLAMVTKEVAKDVFSKSPSLESVISAQSVYPEEGEKDKSDRVAVHRHSMITPALPEARSEVNNNSQSLSSSSSSESSDVGGYGADQSMIQPNYYSLQRRTTFYETFGDFSEVPYGKKEGGSNSSVWDENEEVQEESKIQDHHSNENNFSHVGTSEVDVTLRDLEHPLAWKKSESALCFFDGQEAAAAGMKEEGDGTANSHTTACKTSPTQMTHRSSIASIASRKSMFLEDFRPVEETIPGIENIVEELDHKMADDKGAGASAAVGGMTAKEFEHLLPKPQEVYKVAAIQPDGFVAGICEDVSMKEDSMRKSTVVKLSTPPIQQIQKVTFAQRRPPSLQHQQYPRPAYAPPPPPLGHSPAAPATTQDAPASKETVVKRLEKVPAVETASKRVTFAAPPRARVVPLRRPASAKLSNLDFWRSKELQNAQPPPQPAMDFAAAAASLSRNSSMDTSQKSFQKRPKKNQQQCRLGESDI